MSYRQITRPFGDLNILPAAQYNGNLETLQGVVRLIDGMLAELYAVIPGGGATGVLVTDGAPGSGAITGYSPPGFGSTTDRLDVAANDAGTTLNDLTAGFDGQRVRIRNSGGVGPLALTNENSGSTASSRFTGEGDPTINPGGHIDIVYYGGSVNRWVI